MKRTAAALTLICCLIYVPASAFFQDVPETDEGKKAAAMEMYHDYKSKAFPDAPEISAREVLDRPLGGMIFVDVRSPEEQAISMLPGALTMESFLAAPSLFSDRTVVAYCTIGWRSGKFAIKMNAKGLKVWNLAGGLLIWLHEGGKVFDAAGETRRIHVYGRKWNLAPGGYEGIW